MMVIKDSFLEIWRSKTSYIIFIFFLLGLSHTLAIVNSVNKWEFYVKTSFSSKILFITCGYLLFSYIWKSLILILISSFLLSKRIYQHKLYFLFFNLNEKSFFILRILSVIIICFFIYLIWDLISLFIISIFLKIHIKFFLFYTIIENFTIILGSIFAGFIGFYFSPISLSFLLLLIYFSSSLPIFFTPFIKISFPYTFEFLFKKFPNFINIICYFPLKLINAPKGRIDLQPRYYDFLFYFFLCILFVILSFKKLKKMEYDVF
jgi:hypothetical protein